MKHLSAFGRSCRAALLALVFLTGCASADLSPAVNDIGLTGARARFVALGNALYVIDGQQLQILDLGPTGTSTPAVAQTLALGVNIETIYPAGSYLFVGTPAGMFLFDVSLPLQPRSAGYYAQAASCDPLVVDGRWAYLTLRQDRSCGNSPNQLQVVDLDDPTRPTLVRTYPLTHPYGLTVDSARLFVCDEGLRVFDLRTAPTLAPLDAFAMDAREVTPTPNGLLVTGKTGLYQCRYEARSHSLRLLSVIPVVPRP
ncbi:LVIVD repeat-containing protein [Hymenobacter jeollabukensis]|uniref:LVIVD repeat-containing protein n=1 Tax=Hymenobacter jeollabukensis TaxID=2025313 RepID=A0A5R8WRL3_9BACT|nr:hypothetical protein [Hymenobacter jeollabukensis]TLM93031.1 hypothetical protein FDY95_10360 [Hymenobacter jeollabukensis]